MDGSFVYWSKIALGVGTIAGAIILLVIYIAEQNHIKKQEAETKPDIVLVKEVLMPVKKFTAEEAEFELKNGDAFFFTDFNRDGFWSSYGFTIVDSIGNPVKKIPTLTTLSEAKERIKNSDIQNLHIDRNFVFRFIFENKGKSEAKRVIISGKSISGKPPQNFDTTPTNLLPNVQHMFVLDIRVPMSEKVPETMEFEFTVDYSDTDNKAFKKSYKLIWEKRNGIIARITL